MNGIIMSFKKMLQNKNIVTVLGVIIIMAILYFGYSYQIKKQVNPISGIPVAKTTIQPRTKITEDMIDTISVAPIVLNKGDILRSTSDIVGKYSNYNTMIPEGSMFYKDTVVNEEDLPDAVLTKVEKGQILYSFPVDMESTYGNSIYPDNYIDIYMKANRSDNKVMVGKLVENIKVLAVKDSSGRNVFENTSDSRTPAYLMFGVSSEVYYLLRKASYMSGFSVELFPVPHGSSLESEDQQGTTTVTSTTLKNFINANSVANDDIEDKKTTTNNTTTSTTTDTTTEG